MTTNPGAAGPLRFLGPGWFTVVMGFSGIALAWHRAAAVMGESTLGVTLVVGALAAAVFVVLAALQILRWSRYPQAVADDLAHPLRHVFFAALPLGLILLATVLTALVGPTLLGQALWLIGSGAQFAFSVWFVSRWLRTGAGNGLSLAAVTPAYLIPGVGNVVSALAGPALGYAPIAIAQLGVGVALWVVLLALIAVRLAQHGPWPTPLLPATFITVAPPSVLGLGMLQLGAPDFVADAFWGVALFFLLFSASVARRMIAQEFSMAFWALSFPLAAFAALTLRLAPAAGGAMQLVGLAALALASIVVLWLAWSTVQGLRRGQLLRPEPQPAAASASQMQSGGTQPAAG